MPGDRFVDVKFEDVYEVVASFVINDQPQPKQHLGVREPRVCRFCGRSRGEVSFRAVAHVIPASLGNARLFSYEECEECNRRASVLEDALCKFLAPDRALARRRSRGGNKLKALPQRSSIFSDAGSNTVTIETHEDDAKLRIEDLGANRAVVHAVRPKHSPMDMARAIMRMGLFVVDLGEPVAGAMKEWTQGRRDYQPSFLFGHFAGAGSPNTVLIVFRRKPGFDQDAMHVVMLAYGNVVLLVYSPIDDACESLPGPVLAPEPDVATFIPSNLIFEASRVFVAEGKVDAVEVEFEIGYDSKRPRAGPEHM